MFHQGGGMIFADDTVKQIVLDRPMLMPDFFVYGRNRKAISKVRLYKPLWWLKGTLYPI
jgi:hypothetical protein